MSAAGLGRGLLRLGPPIAVGLLVGLLGLELVARWKWQESWQEPSVHQTLGGEELPVYETVRELTRPNLRAIKQRLLPHQQPRNPGTGVRAEAAEGVFRMLVTGDSTTMGSGVAEEDRYTDRLRRRLEAEDPDRPYEIVNIGMNGANSLGAARRLDLLAPHFHSHLYVYGFSTNDIEGPAYRTAASHASTLETGQKYWAAVARIERSPSYLWRFLGSRLLTWQIPDQRDEVLQNFLENPEAWNDFLGGLERFAQAARFRGLCAHVLLHTDLRELDENHPYLEVYQRVEQAARERGLSVSQSFPYFRGREAVPLWVSPFDPHPNREGHALLAEALYDGLKALPPECWVD